MGTFLATGLPRSLISVSVEVVVVDVLRVVLAVPRVCVVVDSAVRYEVPTGLGFVSKQHMCTVMPPEPTMHTLGKSPRISIGMLVHPMCHGAFKSVRMRRDHRRELTIKPREHIVEGKSVSGEVYPARVGCEDSQSLTGPQTIRFIPDCNVRPVLFHFSGEAAHVILPLWSLTVYVKILLENGGPLLTADILIDGAESLCRIHTCKVKAIGELHVRIKLLISLVITMIKRATLILDHTRESV